MAGTQQGLGARKPLPKGVQSAPEGVKHGEGERRAMRWLQQASRLSLCPDCLCVPLAVLQDRRGRRRLRPVPALPEGPGLPRWLPW